MSSPQPSLGADEKGAPSPGADRQQVVQSPQPATSQQRDDAPSQVPSDEMEAMGLSMRATNAELQAKYPELFDTARLSWSAWWTHRWGATTSIGRLASVGVLTLAVVTVFLVVAWITRERIYVQVSQRNDDGARIVGALLAAQEAVAAERDAALETVAAMWQAADATQEAAVAPPSVTALANGEALRATYQRLATATDASISRVIGLLHDKPHVTNDVVEFTERDAPTMRQRKIVTPELYAGSHYRIGSRATRNPALTMDANRLEKHVRSTYLLRQDQRDVERDDAWPPAEALEGVKLDNLGYYALRELRKMVAPTLMELPTTVAADYARVESDIVQLAVRTAMLAESTQLPQLAAIAVATATTDLYATASEAAGDLLNTTYQSTATTAVYLARAVEFVSAVEAAEVAVTQLMPALLDGAEYRRFVLDCEAITSHRVMADLAQEVKTSTLAAAPGALVTGAALTNLNGASSAAMVSLVHTLQRHFDAPEKQTAPSVNRYLSLTVCVLVLMTILLIFVIVEQRHFTRNVLRSARDRSMELTIAYVAAVGNALRRFDLPTATREVAERAKEATTSPGLATVHNRLLRCIACITYAAPTLSAVLFPERSAAAAEYYAVVRRNTPSGSGAGLMDEARKAQSRSGDDSSESHEDKRDVMDRDDPSFGELDPDIDDRVCDGSERRFAVLIFLDISTLFEFQSSTEALDVSREYTPLLANVAEEAVTLHGGVFHGLLGTSLVGSWGATNSVTTAGVENQCEAAARAAYVLSARISIMRRDDKNLRERLTPSIAITAGKVMVATWTRGEQSPVSLAQVVGPPFARANAVLMANYHHRTAIAVDDTAAEQLASVQLPSKPIELLSTALTSVSSKDTSADSGSQGAQTRTMSMPASSGLAGSAQKGETRRTETDGRAHELISLARHRDPDLPARLAEYKASFVLYQRGYHAEALKGFRKYTRLYGYDGSVERIQSLILA